MKNKDILKCYEGLQVLQDSTAARYQARVAFAIIRNMKILQPIAEDIQSTYDNLVYKYATKIDDTHYQVPDDKLQDFKDEVNNLYNIDTEVTLMKVKFKDIENSIMPIKEMDTLYFMIEED